MVAQRAVVATDGTARVTPLELFFDLVFVYAFTQVTALLATNITAVGLIRGLVVLALVWWSWVGYSWLGNVAQADEGLARAAFFLVMIAMFILALTIPESFEDLPGGLFGPLVFVACYLVARIVHLGLFWLAASGDQALRRQLLRFSVTLVFSAILLTVGAIVGPPWQLFLWVAALVADLGGTMAIGASGWRIRSPGHFSERHGLIVIIALGESIVSIGIGVYDLAISWPIIGASTIGIVLAGTMWWLYFDAIVLVAEDALARATSSEVARLARDAFTYLHLPMVAGIVITALGLKKTFEYIGGAEGHSWTDSLNGPAAYAIPLGVGVFVLANVGFRIRIGKVFEPYCVVALVALAVAGWVGALLSVLAALAVVTSVMIVLVAYETIKHSEERHELRSQHHAPAAHHAD